MFFFRFCFRRDGEDAHSWYNEIDATLNKVHDFFSVFWTFQWLNFSFLLIYVHVNSLFVVLGHPIARKYRDVLYTTSWIPLLRGGSRVDIHNTI